MRIIAIVPCRNESWVLPASIPALLRFCDDVVALDHCSTDATPDILHAFSVHRLHEAEPTWREAAYRQRLLDHARELGATHVVTVDADEILTADAVGSIRGEIERLERGDVLRVPWLTLWGSLDQYRDGDMSVWSRAMAPIAFRADSLNYDDSGYDIHMRVPRLASKSIWPKREMGLMHLQHVNQRRVRAKQVLYRLNEVLRWGTPAKQVEARYGPTTDETDMRLAPVRDGWWGAEKANIELDAEPWQADEVRRILAEHGREKFAGLDLMGF